MGVEGLSTYDFEMLLKQFYKKNQILINVCLSPV